eukprot:7306767-Prymnesium_polylepis.1
MHPPWPAVTPELTMRLFRMVNNPLLMCNAPPKAASELIKRLFPVISTLPPNIRKAPPNKAVQVELMMELPSSSLKMPPAEATAPPA